MPLRMVVLESCFLDGSADCARVEMIESMVCGWLVRLGLCDEEKV